MFSLSIYEVPYTDKTLWEIQRNIHKIEAFSSVYSIDGTEAALPHAIY